ncbi:SpoIID/LytB domain-containing protein [Leptospira perolatii]|uniref:SpoIID/LytB domain-containing protein n=1 Tax=Leptospira perolatii TaxID=2023191 RepID=UPI0013FD1744|nr:SpoIID/LytB domain-containing protein [Leptospira perolatii]
MPKQIRVRILTKYKPTSVQLSYRKSRLFLGDQVFPIQNGKLQIQAKQKDIGVFRLSGENSPNQKNIVEKPKFQNVKRLYLTRGNYEIKVSGQDEIFRYSGDLTIESESNSLKILSIISREEYVTVATESEFGTLFSSLEKESSKEILGQFRMSAKAVVRSYSLSNLNRHSQEGYDLCDLTHCLQYSGKVNKIERSKKSEVVLPKEFLIVSKSGKPLETFFHSTCGGILTHPQVYWKNFREGNSEYRSGFDSIRNGEFLCRNSPHFQWETMLTKSEVEKILEAKAISKLEAQEKEGRVYRISYHSASGEHLLSISDFLSKSGKRIGWNRLKSNLFQIKSGPNGFVFQGQGFGHGIGFCQYGAMELASRGKTAKEILEFYFPGTKLEQINLESL